MTPPLAASTRRRLACFGLLALLLYLAAAVGLGAVAGYAKIADAFDRVEPLWLVAVLAGVLVALGGYLLAWRGIAEHPGGPDLTTRERNAAVVAGFGGFMFRGGSALDKQALMAGGLEERAADVRVAGLDALEHLPLALACFGASLFLLVAGRLDPPPLDFVWPWALGPPLGGLIALVAVRHRPARWRAAQGWRRLLGIALDGIAFFGELVQRRAGRVAALGMIASFAGQMFAVWAGIRAFGVGASVPTVILCDAIGYVFTRRSAPLGGAGFIDCFIALCLWDCNVPLATAVCGVFAYRFFSLFVTMPFSWRALPTVDAIGRRRAGGSAVGSVLAT